MFLCALRCTKLALKTDLGATKKAPRGPKSAMPIIGTPMTGGPFWPSGPPISNLVTKLQDLQD